MSRGWRWYVNGGIDASPLGPRHCVPLAYANVHSTRKKARFAAEIAAQARSRVTPTGRALLNFNGGSPARTEELWARLCHYAIVERVEFENEVTIGFRAGREIFKRHGRPTLAQFARSTGRRGRWVVYTDGHAQAVVAGKIRGWASPRQRVHYAVRVEASL